MTIDLAAEMAAARQRRAEQTARALHEARVVAVRAAAHPDALPEDLEALARSFYPRLSEETRALITAEVRAGWAAGARRNTVAAAAAAAVEAPVEVPEEAPAESLVESETAEV